MIETDSYSHVFTPSILGKYDLFEVGNAAKIIDTLAPIEFLDIMEFLESFTFSSAELMTPGGNRSVIAARIDDFFEKKGWTKARLDKEINYYIFTHPSPKKTMEGASEKEKREHLLYPSYQVGYVVDNFKGKVCLDGEWNPKDGNLDRDFQAYRSWYSDGAIVAAVLITRSQEDTRSLAQEIWEDLIKRDSMYCSRKQPVDYRTTTTANFEKAKERIKRGDTGNCPLLLVGIGRKCWDGAVWDGVPSK